MKKYGKTDVVVCENYEALGQTAARSVAERMRALLQEKEQIVMIFAAAESQTTFFRALAREPDLAWDRVVCVNMDDFWDPQMPEMFSCAHQSRTLLYDVVHPRACHAVGFNAPDAELEAKRFEALLCDLAPLDIVCQGIGMSGHLALNEPGYTDFGDDRWVRVVDLAESSKEQLRTDPNFCELGYIPEQGITMTIPALCSAKSLFTIVPLSNKRTIVTRLFGTPQPTEDLPASILSQCEGTLFLDRDSCPELLI